MRTGNRLSAVLILLLLTARVSQPLAAQAESMGEAGRSGQRALLSRILEENILPFWYPRVLDRDNGGYRLNHDRQGHWMGSAPTALVTQARTVWFFSRLVNSGYGKPEYLEAARHGYRFLRDRMWDPEHGGFYWEVDAAGKEPTRAGKHLYGQSFGLYALAEFTVASGESEALELAHRLFELLERHAHDREYGGYREFFDRDWTLPSGPGEGYMNVPASIKLMNTHLHLMEALTRYYEAGESPLARERLIELIFIQSNAVVRKEVGACTDKYQMDWTPLEGPQYERVSYGHDVENVWLLIAACQAANLSNGPLLDLYRTLMDYSLKHGFDWQSGGFYDSGPFNGSADRRDKIWWVQAEGLVGTLMLHKLTGDPRYYEAFSKTLEWIAQHQVDWKVGDWFQTLTEAGEVQGVKSGAWKSPYHNARAVLVALELLGEED